MLLVAALLLAIFVLPLPWGAALVGVAIVLEVAGKVMWAKVSTRDPARAGPETLIGSTARVVSPCDPYGHVRISGELWRARSHGWLAEGEDVRVRDRDGLTVFVEPESEELAEA